MKVFKQTILGNGKVKFDSNKEYFKDYYLQNFDGKYQWGYEKIENLLFLAQNEDINCYEVARCIGDHKYFWNNYI